MSASNWAKCPRCVQRCDDELAARLVQVGSSYGLVPIEEFDAARTQLDNDRAAHEKDDEHRTFREDYEIYGAADGVVEVSYGGGCEECGLTLSFTHEHPLDVDGAS